MRTPSPLGTWRKSNLAKAEMWFYVIALAAIALFSSNAVFAQQGGLSVPLDLARMVDESENIVLGRITALKAEPHPQYQNLDTVVVTVSVTEPLKGNPGKEFTFREFVSDIRDRDTLLGYRLGEEVVLLVRRPSQYGMTSTVGLGQGRFHVDRDASNNRMVRNGQDNLALFDGIDQTSPGVKPRLSPALRARVESHKSGPISYDDLKAFVQSALAARQAAQ